MAIPAEFQEREYESLFIQELAKLGSFTWSPGQTDEFLLGFDGASYVNPNQLFKFGFPTPVPVSRWHHWVWPMWEPDFWLGRRLSSSLLNEWSNFADEFFAQQALNFFVQHKRPYQTTEQGASGDYWKQAYFEFKIDVQQQKRLEKLEHALGSSAIVTYACAAFLPKSKLWECQRETKIIENSNFIGAGKLTGHSRYTFVEAGQSGFANADPTPMQDEPILSKFDVALDSSKSIFSAQIKRAGSAVNEIMSNDETGGADLYFLLLDRASDIYERDDRTSGLMRSVLQVVTFCTVNSTSWTIATPPKKRVK